MPNGHGPKEYGGHEYADGGTSNCKHGCKCWMGPAMSGGPTGLDPFGKCPKNPKDGQLLGGNLDYDYVVNERIRSLESRCYSAETLLKAVEPSKIILIEELVSVKKELDQRDNLIAKVRRILETGA